MRTQLRRIVTVVATGAQGSSVVRFLLKDGNYDIRVILKDNNSSLAKSLPGLETDIKIFKFSELDKAFEGAYGAFLVANYYSGEDQIEESGKKLIDAAVRNNVKHIIWSSDYDSGALSNGEIRLPKFDSKHDVEEYAKLNREPIFTFLHPALYLQNLYTSLKPIDINGEKFLCLPVDETAKLSFTDIDEFGGVVVGIFNRGDEYRDADIMAVNGVVTPIELAKLLSEKSGFNVMFKQVTIEEFGKVSNKEVGDIVMFYDKFVNRDAEVSRKIYPGMKDLSKWVDTCGVNWRDLLGAKASSAE